MKMRRKVKHYVLLLSAFLILIHTLQYFIVPAILYPRKLSLESKPLFEGRQFTQIGATANISKGFLTIGIPTIRRQNESYLNYTLKSLLDDIDLNTYESSRLKIKIVILLADSDKAYNTEVVSNISSVYERFVDLDIVRFLRVPSSYYPDLRLLRQTLGDSSLRIKWRSKQNLDYSFLMAYSAELSEYYMQLEDDVVGVPGYLKKIHDYIQLNRSTWTMLDFSEKGFIGKLYHSADAVKMSVLLKTFYNEMPCDLLLLYFLKMMLQTRRFVHRPRLFQHIGIHSSLANQTRDSDIPKDFIHRVKLAGDNPAADIFSSFNVYEDNNMADMYDPQHKQSFFWARAPKKGDFITVAFKQQQLVKQIVIDSGFSVINRDRLEFGKVEAGIQDKSTTAIKSRRCIPRHFIGEFLAGAINYTAVLPIPVSCLTISITKSQAPWVLIHNFAIFVVKW